MMRAGTTWNMHGALARFIKDTRNVEVKKSNYGFTKSKFTLDFIARVFHLHVQILLVDP